MFRRTNTNNKAEAHDDVEYQHQHHQDLEPFPQACGGGDANGDDAVSTAIVTKMLKDDRFRASTKQFVHDLLDNDGGPRASVIMNEIDEKKKTKAMLKMVIVGALILIVALIIVAVITTVISVKLMKEISVGGDNTLINYKTNKPIGALQKGILVTLQPCRNEEEDVLLQLLKEEFLPFQDKALVETGTMSCEDAQVVASCIDTFCNIVMETSLTSTAVQKARVNLEFAEESLQQLSTGDYVAIIDGLKFMNQQNNDDQYDIVCQLPPGYVEQVVPNPGISTVVPLDTMTTNSTSSCLALSDLNMVFRDASWSCNDVPVCVVYKRFSLSNAAEVFTMGSKTAQSTSEVLLQVKKLTEADAVDDLSAEDVVTNLQPLIDAILNEGLKDEDQDIITTKTEPLEIVEIIRNIYQGKYYSYVGNIDSFEMARRRLQNRHLSTAVSLHETNMNRRLWFEAHGEGSCSEYRYYMVSSATGTMIMALMLINGVPLSGAVNMSIRKMADACTDVIPQCLLDKWMKEIDFSGLGSNANVPGPDASDYDKLLFFDFSLIDFFNMFLVNIVIFTKIVGTVGAGYILKQIYINMEWYHFTIISTVLVVKIIAWALSGGGAAWADAAVIFTKIATALDVIGIVDNILQLIVAVIEYYKNNCDLEFSQMEIDDCDFSPCGMDGVQEVNQSCGKGIGAKWCKPDYCCDLDTNTCFDEDTFTPRNLVCNRGGTKDWGQSCGVQPFPKWCKNNYCCDTDLKKCVRIVEDTEVWEYEYPKDKYQCKDGGKRGAGNGQSCGKQPAPRWCKNGYCCDTKINKCVPVSDVGTNNVIPVITRRKLHFLSAADEMFPM